MEVEAPPEAAAALSAEDAARQAEQQYAAELQKELAGGADANEMAADERPEAPQQTDKVCLTTCIIVGQFKDEFMCPSFKQVDLSGSSPVKASCSVLLARATGLDPAIALQLLAYHGGSLVCMPCRARGNGKPLTQRRRARQRTTWRLRCCRGSSATCTRPYRSRTRPSAHACRSSSADGLPWRRTEDRYQIVRPGVATYLLSNSKRVRRSECRSE